MIIKCVGQTCSYHNTEKVTTCLLNTAKPFQVTSTSNTNPLSNLCITRLSNSIGCMHSVTSQRRRIKRLNETLIYRKSNHHEVENKPFAIILTRFLYLLYVVPVNQLLKSI